MVVALFFLSILLGFITILALIIPKKILFFIKNPSRSKALLFIGLPAIILFAVSMATTPTRLELALEEPGKTTNLSLSGKKISSLPEEIATLTNLQKLDLSNNRFIEFPEMIKSLKNLTFLDLSENPISQIPDWVLSLPGITEIKLDDTNLSAIPEKFEMLTISYQNTPLSDAVSAEKLMADKKTLAIEKRANSEGHSESFSEFALREILGNDYGFKRKFKKGEVYYEDPVTKAEADKIGNFFVGLNYFNDENEVSVLLNKDDDGIYLLKMVVLEDQLNNEAIDAFGDIRKWIKEDIFPNNELHLHLIDSELDVLKR